jgi:hypothetical protein
LKRCKNGHDVPDDHKRCPVCEASTPVIRERTCKSGHPNPDNRRWCSDCGVRIQIKEGGVQFAIEEDQVEWKSCEFDHATFMGGLSQEDRKLTGTLVLDQQGIRVDQTEILQWGDCAGLAVESYQVAKRKIAATLVFGVLGGVAAKGSKNQSAMTVRRNDGALAYFVIDNRNSPEVKAKIAPLLRSIGLPLVGDFPLESTLPRSSGNDIALESTLPRSSRNDIASQIERLVALKQSGHIDDDEFKLLKGKLFE